MAATVAVTGPKHVKAKVCLVGDVAVGKTSLIKRFVLDDFDDRYIATVGTKVTKKTVDVTWKGVPATLDLMVWDIMGEKGFRELLKEAYFHGAQGVLAVCDVTRKDTLKDLDDWVAAVVKVTGNVPIEFLANKSDLKDQMEVSDSDVSRAAAAYKAPYLFTSAKTGANVEEAFSTLAQMISRRS